NQATLNMDKLAAIKLLFDEVIPFVQQVYLVDACAVAALYNDWFHIGRGVTNYLAVPDLPLDSKGTQFDLPGGYIMARHVGGVQRAHTAHDSYSPQWFADDAAHPYYKGGSLHPWKGETVPDFPDFHPNGNYTWVKAPRFQGKPMQVGPLSQVLVGYAQGHALT